MTLALETVHAPSQDHGYIGNLVVAPAGDVFAIGGTYHRPTLLHSSDGGHTFEPWSVPQASGLRDVLVDGDRVWIVGEYGIIAHTIDRGATWQSRKVAATPCLYSIARDGRGRTWITGDGGLVLRSRGDRFARVDNHSGTRVLGVWIDPADGMPWLYDSGGMLQRWQRKQFVVVALAAMKRTRPLTNLLRTPAGTLIVTADDGLILRSSTDGASWKRVAVPTKASFETIALTPFGIFVVGDRGTLLVSHDDGKQFRELATGLTSHLWSIAMTDDGVLIGADAGAIYRLDVPALAGILRDGHARSVISDLASRVHDGEPGARLVLEDALRERELW
ncbi:MAG TPA: YCF48-related protein [Kofleriaceae bacterium]|nr:YCF48-related protein [Kofleriaceae bacterium]